MVSLHKNHILFSIIKGSDLVPYKGQVTSAIGHRNDRQLYVIHEVCLIGFSYDQIN